MIPTIPPLDLVTSFYGFYGTHPVSQYRIRSSTTLHFWQNGLSNYSIEPSQSIELDNELQIVSIFDLFPPRVL